MAAAAEVRRPGGCRPCHRVHRVVVTRRRQQDSGIHVGSRFGKLLFLTTDGWTEGSILFLQVLQVSVAQGLPDGDFLSHLL